MSQSDRIQALFGAAVQLQTAAREEFVARSGESPEVQAEVLRLLEHELGAGDFLQRPAAETFAALAGNRLNQVAEFRVIREIGRGGMGIVYLAEDTVLKRQVALKVLGSHLTGSDSSVARFQREAQAAARLSHPNIVPIHRYGEDRGTHFIAMPFVEGQTLDKRLRSLRASDDLGEEAARLLQKAGGRPTRTHDKSPTASAEYARNCARLARGVAQGLDYAHHAGVLHRDIKPSNILIDPAGQPRITDFGIARIETDEKLTKSGDVTGTYHYMSPEQLAAEDLDRRTDVYSLGVVLYEMLTLIRPFEGDSLQSIANSFRAFDPIPVRVLNRAVSVDLETICHKALEKKLGHRYPTAAHMAADLECFLLNEPILARPPTVSRRIARWFRRHRTASIAAAFLFLLTSLGAAGGMQLQNHWASMASVSIHLAPAAPNAMAYVRRWNHDSQSYDPVETLGLVPIIEEYLDPGPCRFVVIRDGEFMEFDEVLTAGEPIDRTISIPDQVAVAAGMIAFGAGEYTVSITNPNETSQDQALQLEGFMLDRTEVSNAAYKEFVDATGYSQQPTLWRLFGYDPGLAQRPVVGVSRADAETYARWIGKRLPTAVEWEAAARAPDGRHYPWGTFEATPPQAIPDCEALANHQNTESAAYHAEYSMRSANVDNDESDVTPTGLLFMYGNVTELTSTVEPTAFNILLLRGASWWVHPQYRDLRGTTQYPRTANSFDIGFRCARSLEPPSPPLQE